MFLSRVFEAAGAVFGLAAIVFFVPMLSAAMRKRTIREVAMSMEPGLTSVFVLIWLLICVAVPLADHFLPRSSVPAASTKPAVAPTLETYLSQVARDVNRSLPLTRDGVETLGAAATGRLMAVKYQFVSRYKADIDIEALRKKAFAQSQRQACTDPATKALLDAGATLSKTYVDANHEHLVTYEVSAADCGSPAQAR